MDRQVENMMPEDMSVADSYKKHFHAVHAAVIKTGKLRTSAAWVDFQLISGSCSTFGCFTFYKYKTVKDQTRG